MQKILSAALLGTVLSLLSAPVMAQGGTPTPQTSADCKADEMWDETRKACVKR